MSQNKPGLEAGPVLNNDGFGSAHLGSANFVFCGGVAHSISFAVDPKVWLRLGSRNASQIIGVGATAGIK
jgi:hypothetical protein